MGKLCAGRWSFFLSLVLLTGVLAACLPAAESNRSAQRRDAKPTASPDGQSAAIDPAEKNPRNAPALAPTATPTAFFTATPGPTATATPPPLSTPDVDRASQLTAEAKTLFLASDLARAEARAIEAIAADPSHLPAYLQLTDVYLYLPHYWQQALHSAEAAVALAPDDALALAYLAWAQAGAHRYDEARESAARAVDLAPDSAAAHQALADVLSHEYELEAAYGAAQEAVDLAPENASAWVSLGTIASSLEYPNRAREAYERAVELEPDFFTWRILLARHELDHSGDVDAALALAEPALAVQPDHPFVLAFLVDVAIERNDWPAGEANCRKLFVYNQPATPYPDAYSCMASLKLFQEDNAGADYFQSLAEANAPPERFDVLVMRMRLLNDDDQCAESRALAETWLAERPYSVLALRMIGVSYLCADAYEQAADYFEQALTRLPRSVADARLLANAYARDDKPSEARAALERVRTFASENPLYYQAIYEVHLFLGQTKDAIRAAQRWQFLRPNSTEALTSLALAELFDNDPTAAQNHAQSALDAGATSSTLYAILGESYSRTGDFANAEKNLLKALAINSEHFLARNFLAQLYLFSGHCNQAVPHIEWLTKDSADDQETAARYSEYLKLCREQATATAPPPDEATPLDDATALEAVKANLREARVTARAVEFSEDQTQRSLFVSYNSDLAPDSREFSELEYEVAIQLAKLLPRIESGPDGLLMVSGAQLQPQHILFIATRAATRWAAGDLSDAEFEATWLIRRADTLRDEQEDRRITTLTERTRG